MLERLELEAFLTLAEELHFGRTADRLGLTTSRISQTIRRLERRIGAALFERNSRKVALTDVGRQLRDDLRPAYDQINAGIAAASRGNVVPRTLMVGFSGPWCGNLMVRAAELLRKRYPGSVVSVEEIQLVEPLARMRSGVIDLQLTEFPIAEPDIATGPILFSEPRALMVPIEHRFAQKDSISLEDLADTTQVTLAAESIPQYWMDYYFPRRTPTGRPIPQGPAARFWPEVLVHISQGVGVSTVAARAEQFHSRPGMAFVPFRDAPPIDYGLMWPTANRNPLRRPYIDILATLAAAEADSAEHP